VTSENPDTESVGGLKGPDGPLLKLFRNRGFAFLIVGGMNTAIGFVWFIAFTGLFHALAPGADWTVFPIILCAQWTSATCAFFLYRHLVFRVTGHFWLDYGRFLLVNATSAALNLIVVPPVVIRLGWPKILAQLAFTVVIAVISWFGHSQFSFRRSKKDSA
jgi:putative flippase GtrA